MEDEEIKYPKEPTEEEIEEIDENLLGEDIEPEEDADEVDFDEES